MPGSLARRRERWFYLLITPWLLGLALFQAGPALGALGMAFADWPLPRPPVFIGLAHIRQLFTDPLVGVTLFNSIYYAAGSIPAGLALGLGLALALQRPRRGTALFQAIFFLPVIVSGVATILVWGWLFNPRLGLINHLLALVGIQGPAWLQDKLWAMPALILMSLWGVGVNMLIYLAALREVPVELYEAAALDGAAGWRLFRTITWPLISPVTFYLAVANLIGAFQVFTPAYLLTRGGPENTTLTLPLYIYLNAFSYGKLGYASALAFVLLLLVLGLTLLQIRLGHRWVFYPGAA